MSDWPTLRKNDAPRGGAGDTALEAMASVPRPPDCPRSSPALRGRFFAWKEARKHARSVDVERRRAITAPASAQRAARGGLKRAFPPLQCRLLGFFAFQRQRFGHLNVEPAQTTLAGNGVCAASMRSPFLWGKRIGSLEIRRRRAITDLGRIANRRPRRLEERRRVASMPALGAFR